MGYACNIADVLVDLLERAVEAPQAPVVVGSGGVESFV